MNKTIKLAALAFMAALFSPPPSFSGAKAIYGDDSRNDYFAVSAERRALADSVVSLWSIYNINPQPGGKFKLGTRRFADRPMDDKGGKLCPTERYREQPAGALCSGTLVGEDLVMTAGHCIHTQAECDDTKLVFGFAVLKAGRAAPETVPAVNVYSCKAIVASKFEASVRGAAVKDLDYAIIRLDRKVKGRRPLPINRDGGLTNGSALLVIGHPVGLPVKIADDASVINMRGSDIYFEANLDTYGGNSGSAVFNAKTGLVEGILVSGRVDFQKTPAGCYISSILEQSPSHGEAVTKISQVSGFIPELPGTGPAAAAKPRIINVDMGSPRIEPPADIKLSF